MKVSLSLYITAVVIALTLPSVLSAQDGHRRHGSKEDDGPSEELYVAYGAGSVPQMFNVLSDLLVAPVTAGLATGETKSAFGPVILGIRYFPESWLSLGVEGVYESYDKQYTDNSSGEVYPYTMTFTTLMGTLDFHWLNGDVVQLSSGISAGASFNAQDPERAGDATERQTLFAFQFSPLRVRVGGKFGVFAEAGLGYRGLVSIGASLRL